MRTYWRRAGPKPRMTGVAIRREDTESPTQREGDHVVTEAEIGVKSLLAKSGWRQQRVRERQGADSSRAFREITVLPTN